MPPILFLPTDALPAPLWRAAALPFGDSFMLVGGEGPDGPSGAIWLWDPTTSTFQLQPAVLETPRSGETAFFVESATFPKCGNFPNVTKSPLDM